MTEPTTAAGRAHHLYLHASDGFITELDDVTPNSGYCPEEPDQECGYITAILAIEAEARQQDVSALREALELANGGGHLEVLMEEGNYKQAAADILTALPPSTPPALDDLTREHRKCGPKYEGCYAHWPMDHCRADGMAWPCDVAHIRARLQEQDR